MAQLGRDFVLQLSGFGADFEFNGNHYKTLWTAVRGPVCKRRNYKQDWIMIDMWPVNEKTGNQIGGEVAVGSDAWTAALESQNDHDAFFGTRIRIGELGVFQFADDYKPSLPRFMVEEQLLRFLEQLELKPEWHADPIWHEMFMDVYKQYEFYRERSLKESIFFYHWSRDCDLCESEGVEVFSDWFEAAEWINCFGESAEGPQSLHQMTYEQWRVFTPEPMRDRGLEHFEEYGYGH